MGTVLSVSQVRKLGLRDVISSVTSGTSQQQWGEAWDMAVAAQCSPTYDADGPHAQMHTHADTLCTHAHLWPKALWRATERKRDEVEEVEKPTRSLPNH